MGSSQYILINVGSLRDPMFTTIVRLRKSLSLKTQTFQPIKEEYKQKSVNTWESGSQRTCIKPLEKSHKLEQWGLLKQLQIPGYNGLVFHLNGKTQELRSLFQRSSKSGTPISVTPKLNFAKRAKILKVGCYLCTAYLMGNQKQELPI